MDFEGVFNVMYSRQVSFHLDFQMCISPFLPLGVPFQYKNTEAFTPYIEIQDQVKKWRPNLANVTHSY